MANIIIDSQNENEENLGGIFKLEIAVYLFPAVHDLAYYKSEVRGTFGLYALDNYEINFVSGKWPELEVKTIQKNNAEHHLSEIKFSIARKSKLFEEFHTQVKGHCLNVLAYDLNGNRWMLGDAFSSAKLKMDSSTGNGPTDRNEQKFMLEWLSMEPPRLFEN